MSVQFTDNNDEILEKLKAAKLRGLVRCGSQAHGYAADLVPVDSGALRNTIAFKVDPDELAAYVGTNSEYAAYVELGTGKYHPGGRKGWWVYVDGGSSVQSKNPGKIYTYEEAKKIVAILRSKGLAAHMTDGQEPQPFLKPAVENHKDDYYNIIKDELKNAF